MIQISRCLLLFVMLFCVSCAPPGRKTNVMTLDNYVEVQPGMSEGSLRRLYGEPYNTYQRDDGVTIYEYIERFQMGPNERTVQSRRYYFIVQDGKVIGKQVRIYNQPGYIDPYNDVDY